MTQKQERWVTIERDDPGSTRRLDDTTLRGFSSRGDAENEAGARARAGYTVEIALIVAIVRPPALGAPQWERLPGAPRKRRVNPLITHGLMTPEEARQAMGLDEKPLVNDDSANAQPAPEQASPATVAGPGAALAGVRARLLAHEAAASVALDKGDGGTHSVGEPPSPACPLCATGNAPAKGMHTDTKGKRHRCVDASKKEKA